LNAVQPLDKPYESMDERPGQESASKVYLTVQTNF
jgi:hypothetical protein